MSAKPFKGVLSNWCRDGDVVVGTRIYDPEMDAELTGNAIWFDRIVRGQQMHTSRVERIEKCGSFCICETRNSFYVLVEPR